MPDNTDNMVTLVTRHYYGERKATRFPDAFAAHHALMVSADRWGYTVGHDGTPPVPGTMSGIFTVEGRFRFRGDWIIGPVSMENAMTVRNWPPTRMEL